MRATRVIGAVLVAVLMGAGGSPVWADPSDSIPRCGTPERLDLIAQQPLASEFPALATSEKLVRDAFDNAYTQRLSTNFVVKWLDSSITQTDAQNVLDALERGWSKYVTELRHSAPTGALTYRINAYLSRETDQPAIDYAGGYATIDFEGFPYLVVSRDLLSKPQNLEKVSIHELYHLIQFATGAYPGTTYAWYWEATADWAAIQTVPTNPKSYVLSGGLALRPDLPLYSWVDFRTDYIAGTHQYGASLFFVHLTNKFGDPQIVAASWKNAPLGAEPIAMVTSLLPASTSLPTLFAEFAAHNAIWDYPGRDAIQASIALFKESYPTADEIAARVPAAGAPLTMLQEKTYGLGYATIELARPSTGWVDVELQMTQLAPDVRLQATFVAGSPGSAIYTPLTIDGTKATGKLGFPEGVTTAYLSIAPTTDRRTTAIEVPLSYRVTPTEGPPIAIDNPNDNGAASSDGDVVPVLGGCRAGGGWSTWFPGIAVLALFLVRRRGQARRELAFWQLLDRPQHRSTADS